MYLVPKKEQDWREHKSGMQSLFDERNWLAWLVKVRIIILTLLLGIELSIARLTPNPLPVALFVSIVLLWYALSGFYLLLLPLDSGSSSIRSFLRRLIKTRIPR